MIISVVLVLLYLSWGEVDLGETPKSGTCTEFKVVHSVPQTLT
jgi:hypothetical protein